MNPIALQSALLPGETLDEQLRAAAVAGADGVELDATPTLYTAIPDITAAAARNHLKVSALRVGITHLIHPEFAEREQAVVSMRRALAAAVDLSAAGVVFYGHYAPHHVLPDLHPYKSPVELEAELLIAELRSTLCDLAYALGAKLFLAHGDSSTTALLRRPEHAALIRAKLDNHPFLHVATSLANLDREGISEPVALATPGIGYISACDTGGALPGQGRRDWNAFASLLRANNYEGWITLEGSAPQSQGALLAAVKALRDAGI